jgi:hypothetical protein
MAAAYVARGGQPFPELMEPPDLTGGSLLEVAEALSRLPGAG